MRPPILSEYPSAIANLDWVALGNAGGFSGAAIWQGRSDSGPQFCLKQWPADYPQARLEEIHRLMLRARQAGLLFVPDVVPSRDGTTVFTADNRVWDLTTWLPGTADFATRPSDARLISAVSALAALHRAWAPAIPRLAPCPGIRRRIEILHSFRESLPVHSSFSPIVPRLRQRIPRALVELADWQDQPLPPQPCLCDPWHDHLLFTGDTLTALVDFGAVKVDHPAVDLARMLGDLVGEDEPRFRFGLEAYRAAGGPVEVPDELVRLLDETGVLCALIGWLRRLAGSDPIGPSLSRIIKLVHRLETLPVR